MAKYLTVHKAIEELTGSRPNPSTVWRWTAKGSKGVKLQTWMIGGRRMTTSEAVNDFIEARSKQPEITRTADAVVAELNRMLGAKLLPIKKMHPPVKSLSV